ncbi:MAG: hypothetical protein RL033_2587 [Pseudomonadota bacterium]|jgi:hypothetical protein
MHELTTSSLGKPTVVDASLSTCASYRATRVGSVRAPQGRRLKASMTATGYGSAETSLAVARDGTLFMAPGYSAEGNGVLRSRDHGQTWELLPLRLPDGSSTTREQPYMFMDPVTERLFVHNSVMRFRPPDFRGGYHQFISDDQGDSWRYQCFAPEVRDWSKYCAGPAVHSQTIDYPHALYFSGPSPLSTRFFPVMAPRFQSFRRSLDGGRSWQRVGQISLSPRDVPNISRWEWVIFGNGVVGPDGSVYWIFRRGPQLALAISRDEGASWDIVDVPNAPLLPFFNILQVGFVNPNYVIGEALSIDTLGNLYLVWPDPDDRLRFSVSRDGGQTFSEPVVISAPDVVNVSFGVATVKEPGVIAIAYYGSFDGKSHHGYVAESRDALSTEPSFTGGIINPIDDPLYPHGFKVGYDQMILGGDLNEIVHVRYAPNGDILASFNKRMRRGAQKKGGWNAREHANSRLQAVLGRLS